MSAPTEGHVRDSDAFTIHMERDPLLRSTITAVALFDHAPDWEVLVQRVDRATRLEPSFRERVVPSPFGLGPPRWVLDPDFDLDWHLRRVAAPEPRTVEAVLAMARVAGMTAFDPARPLWELTLVEGLEGGGAALVIKVHHALTDGIGGIQLAAHIVDLEPKPSSVGPLPPEPAAAPAGAVHRLADAVGVDLARWTHMAGTLVGAAPLATVRAIRNPARAVATAAGTAASIARLIRPVTRTLSPVMTQRRLRWHFDVLEVPVADLKAAGKAAGGTLNDAFLAALAAGLRRYHREHDADVDTLRVTMPISLRTPDDPAGGNRVTLVRFEVPVGLEDPLARMRSIGDTAARLRAEPALPHSEALAGVLNLLPTTVTGGMLKHIDFLASNVPGFPAPVYVGGARLEAFYPFGPTIGSAANITLMSYCDTCHLGVNTDEGAVPDPDVFLRCLAEGFAEVVAVGVPTDDP